MYNLPESTKYNKPQYKILTPNGYESFIGVNKITKTQYLHLRFSNGMELKCSEDHPLITIDGLQRAKDISKKTQIETKDGLGCFIKSRRLVKKKIDLYDIINSGKDNIYYTNDILSHNCDFLGSTNTLVCAEKLACLNFMNTDAFYMGAKIYENPIKEILNPDTDEVQQKDHIYVICVDVSEGKNLDYSAFSVIDVSVMPYKQVAIYRNNSIPPILYPTVIKSLAEYYNDAFVLVEINNNPQVADILIEEMGYDNVFRVKSGNKKAQTICLAWGKNIQNGVKMSPLVKRMGCAMVKTLIESDKLVINDFDTISELTTFIQDGPTYHAEEGHNDDLVASLILFGWITTQKVFKEMLEHDLRKTLQAEHFIDHNNEDMPLLFEPTTGREIPHFVEDGSVWVESQYQYQDAYNEFFDYYFKQSVTKGIF